MGQKGWDAIHMWMKYGGGVLQYGGCNMGGCNMGGCMTLHETKGLGCHTYVDEIWGGVQYGGCNLPLQRLMSK